MAKFKVGDKIQVVNNGQTYSLYYRNEKQVPDCWENEYAPEIGDTGIVSKIVHHRRTGEDILLIELRKVYLIGKDGVKLFKKR